MHSLRVALGERSYPIHLGTGVLDDATLYAPHATGRRAAIITNSVVAPLYLDRVERALAASGTPSVRIVVPDGEAAKGWETLDRVFDELLAARCDRDTLIVALGGGVVGDLAGFAAATYQRGVPCLQIPTTLLSQVDSSVGGKTAINHARGKNMVGAFHQPQAVLADIDVLGTLPARELRAGLAEVIKHGLALDAGFADWIEANIAALVAGEAAALEHVVLRSCELKAAVVAEDEREVGRRALLNLGHTFGHAIEAGMGYGVWLHGEAVAAGMVMAADLSVRAGMLANGDAARVRSLVARAGLPWQGPAELSPARYLELMATDKKVTAGDIRFVLLEAIGQAVMRSDIDPALAQASIAHCTQGPGAA